MECCKGVCQKWLGEVGKKYKTNLCLGRKHLEFEKICCKGEEGRSRFFFISR